MVTTRPIEAFKGAPKHQLDILVRLGVPIADAADVQDVGVDLQGLREGLRAGIGGMAPDEFDLVVDAVIGYGLSGPPREESAHLIDLANELNSPILSLDTPSGVDTATGVIHEPAVRAAATLTLALPKEGLRSPQAARHVGELYLADIGVPPVVYAHQGLELDVGPLFRHSDILRVPESARPTRRPLSFTRRCRQ